MRSVDYFIFRVYSSSKCLAFLHQWPSVSFNKCVLIPPPPPPLCGCMLCTQGASDPDNWMCSRNLPCGEGRQKSNVCELYGCLMYNRGDTEGPQWLMTVGHDLEESRVYGSFRNTYCLFVGSLQNIAVFRCNFSGRHLGCSTLHT